MKVNSMSWDNWSNYGWHLDHIIPLIVHHDFKSKEKNVTIIKFSAFVGQENIKKI